MHTCAESGRNKTIHNVCCMLMTLLLSGHRYKPGIYHFIHIGLFQFFLPLYDRTMGGFRCRRITVISTCAERGRTETQLRPGISVTSFALHPSSSIPVYPPFSLQSSHNMSAADVVGPRRLLGGFSMKACRKLVFDASPEQNDREEDGIQDSTDNYIQEHVERQSRRWGFNFSTGEPLPNSRLDWVAESEERVPAYYREVCLRSPPRRNLRAVRRNIMSARRSESTEQHHSADNGFVVGGQVNNSRVIPGNNLAASSTVSARPETETASATVSTSSPSVHHNNEETREERFYHGISKSSSPSTSQARKTQSHIDDFFNQRKRRCSSETKDSSAKRTKSFPDRLDRPRSAPAAVATSS